VAAGKRRGKKGDTSEPGRERPAARAPRLLVVDPHCLDDLQHWMGTEMRVAVKALDLIEHVMREPFDGPGKPEPLKRLAPNTWSRRLTGEHRLVYTVFHDRIVFLQARFHY
jgi:toxin YoeB